MTTIDTPKRQLLSRRTMQAVGIMLLIALPFWLVALVYNGQQAAFTKNGISTTAKIIAKDKRTAQRSKNSKFGTNISGSNYFITYQFPLSKDGKPAGTYSHTKQIRRADFKDYGIGGSIAIRYEATNPKNHIVTSLEKDNGSDTMLTIALILTVVAGGIAGASVFKYIFYSPNPE